MKLLRTLIRSLSTQEKPVLGRWQLENSISTINYKVDLANEDHCGLCSQYANQKVKLLEVIQISLTQDSDFSEEEEEYLKFMM